MMIRKHLQCLLTLCFIGLARPVFADEKALPEPRDFTLTWIDEFKIKLSWNPSKDLDPSCEVKYKLNASYSLDTLNTFFDGMSVFLDKPVTYTVQTIPTKCGDRTISKPASISVTTTKLVKNFKCFLYSTMAMNCSWLIANQAAEDLRFYYKYAGQNHTVECSQYLYRGVQKTGCHLRGTISPSDCNMYFLINMTVNGLSVRNTFWVNPNNNVMPPAPKVKITNKSNDLNVSWTHPEYAPHHCWIYTLNYSRCQDTQLSKQLQQVNAIIPYDPRCQYRFQVKAVLSDTCGKGESDWSEEELYGVEDWSNLVIAVVIPASVFLFVILFLCCLWKCWKNIFPPIPQPPSDFLKMLFGTNEHLASKWDIYVPVKEKVDLLYP
ncbi:hypothetical protein DPEC_G00103870 [Dallia pectoralis]|uniref:Uncharacterized protein n=1 Tax=Dallia pectoralis TaxID=75939 RepID=A0ACC2GY09_DALPE|nr:hypothetical protein DPEC_G00103870 [Dallia pectoralis]